MEMSGTWIVMWVYIFVADVISVIWTTTLICKGLVVKVAAPLRALFCDTKFACWGWAMSNGSALEHYCGYESQGRDWISAKGQEVDTAML